MRSNTLILLCFFCGAALGQAPGASFAKIEFPKELVLLGELQEGEIAEVDFPFLNKGTAPLQLFDLAPNCSCTTADADAMTVAPGKGSVVRARVDTRGRPGNLEKMVIVVSNDPKAAQVTLTIRAVVKDFHKEAGARFLAANIFQEGCRSCHADRARGKSGEALFKAACRVCHRQGHSAPVLDKGWLNRQKTAAWKGMIASGSKSMPGFAVAHKGPLDGAQVESLVRFLDWPAPPAKPAK